MTAVATVVGSGPEHPGTRSTGSTVQGAGWLGLGAGVVKASQTLVLLALAALLAPSAIGVIAIGALVLNVTSAVTDLGSSTALVRWPGDAERAARSALTLALTIAAFLTVVAWFVAPLLSEALNAGDLGVDVIRGLMACLPFLAVAGVSQELLRRALAFKRRVLPDIVAAVVGSGLAVGLAVAGYGAMSLVFGQLVQAVLVMVLCWRMRPPVRPGWRRDDISGLVAYGGHLAGANIMTLLMLNVDYLIVAHVLGTSALGVYSMAFRLAYMPYVLVAFVIGGAAFAHLCRLRGRAVGQAVVDTAAVLGVVMLPLYVGMIVLAPQLELLGEKWAPGVPALRWLAAYGLVLSAVNLCSVALSAVARTRDAFVLNALHLALLTALLGIWVSSGVRMVAVAQLVAVVGTLLIALPVLARRVDGLEWRSLALRLAPAAVGVTLMATTALLLEALLPWTRVSVGGLLMVGTAALAAYLLPVLALDRGARASLRSTIRRRT